MASRNEIINSYIVCHGLQFTFSCSSDRVSRGSLCASSCALPRMYRQNLGGISENRRKNDITVAVQSAASPDAEGFKERRLGVSSIVPNSVNETVG